MINPADAIRLSSAAWGPVEPLRYPYHVMELLAIAAAVALGLHFLIRIPLNASVLPQMLFLERCICMYSGFTS